MICKSVKNVIWAILPAMLLWQCAVTVGNDGLEVCEDQVWLISARGIACSTCAKPEDFGVEHFQQSNWQCSNFEELQSNCNEAITTVIFVHGYQTNLLNAKQRGIQVYENLFGGCDQMAPVRFIIWAWKSEREQPSAVRDYLARSKCAVNLGHAFATSLNIVSGPKIVIGYSLGAQVATAGLMQGGLYQGSPIQLAVIAAATDCNFAARRDFCGCRGNVQRTTIFSNNKDRAIRASSLLCRVQYGRRFQGFNDLAFGSCGGLGQIKLIDISCEASRKHSVVRYTDLPVIKSEIRQIVLDVSFESPAVVAGPVVDVAEEPTLSSMIVPAIIEPVESADQEMALAK